MSLQVIDKCPRCGVRTALNQRAEYQAKNIFDEESGWEEAQYWKLYQCVSCERPILREHWDRPFVEQPSIQTLYPIGTADNSAVPEAVSKAWEAAQAVRHVEPNAFAVLTGRTLEVICQHEGTVEKTLVASLRKLAESNRIPGTLGEMAQKLRHIRNLGAHAASGEVRESDVPVIQDFAEAILEYLYRAPAKLAAVEARLKQKGQTD